MNKAIIILLVLVALIIGLLSFILFGFESSPPSNNVDYNYYQFEEVGGLWQTTLVNNGQPYFAVFRFHPNQTSDVYVTGKFGGFKQGTLYLTFDPNQTTDD